MRKCLHKLISALVFCLLVWQWGEAIRIELKADLAQYLIKHAWDIKLNSPHTFAPPWPWADTEPVARLQWIDSEQKIKKDLFVLNGVQGSTLAFAPGLMNDAGMRGNNGAKVLGGHRDTHFAFLRHIKTGDTFKIQESSGLWQTYQVKQRNVVDSRNQPLWIEPDDESLWLVTCYPFDAIMAGGPLRYVVRADKSKGLG